METITEQEAKDNDLKHVFVKRESKLKFLSVVAEENFIRGYQQAFQDINNKNA